MAYDVKVKIDLKKPTRKLGFGYPLILESKAETAVKYTEVKDLEAVVTAGFAATTDVYKAAQLLFMQDNAPEKIAVCASTDAAVTALAAIKNEGWRQLICITGATSDSTTKEIATYIEATKDKMYFADVDDLTELAGEGAITKLDRTVLFYYNKEGVVCPVAALVGATAGKKVGSFTYKNQILKGLDPLALTDAQIEAAHAANCLTFVTKAGDNVTTEGKVVSGEYIDIIDSKDYIIQQLEYETQRVFNLNDKIGYDNNGIAILENACTNVLQGAFNNGIIATNDDGIADYNVVFAARSETTAEERAERKYTRGTFRFSLMGAIHEAEITGTIEV